MWRGAGTRPGGARSRVGWAAPGRCSLATAGAPCRGTRALLSCPKATSAVATGGTDGRRAREGRAAGRSERTCRRLCARCAARGAGHQARAGRFTAAARARAPATRQSHRAIRAPRGAAQGRQLRRCAVLPWHDHPPGGLAAALPRGRHRLRAGVRARRQSSERPALRGHIERGRRPRRAQFLPAHQGRDGAAAAGSGLRVARHPAAFTATRLARRGASAGARGTRLDALGESPAARPLHRLPRYPRAHRGRGHGRRHSHRPTGRAALHV